MGKRKHSLPVFIRKYLLGIFLAIVSRYIFLPFSKKQNRILTLSHTYSGNAAAFTDWLAQNTNDEIGFICDDPFLFKKLKQKPFPKSIRLLSLHSLKDMKYISGAKIICTTHDPVFLRYWKSSKKRPVFIGMWHGVGFKGGGDNYEKSLGFYEAQFISSPYFKNLHENWGFNSNRLFVTGYARTDKLYSPKLTKKARNEILKQYGINTFDKKIILFAPTWKIDSKNEEKIMNESTQTLMDKLAEIAGKNCLIIFRPHLNTSLKIDKHQQASLKIVASSQYPDTETLLLATDILITDWSSIFTDYLPLKRPIIFLDTPADFKFRGLQPEDRAGTKVKNMEELELAIKLNLDKNQYLIKNSAHIHSVEKKAWGSTLDGNSSARYYMNIRKLLREYYKD